jgi:lipopolysaccharide biosynthesis protein
MRNSLRKANNLKQDLVYSKDNISEFQNFMTISNIRLIAFYLPQFHPIPENDTWWGKGFTEWVNVTKARPLFLGHYQPHLPADLGFYDLRVPETRQAQADLAKEYGIYGFCYYHYWFHGKRLLERPFNEVLASGKPDFPFCLCWANENWTRRWDGRDQEILMKQEFSEKDDHQHIRWLIRAFEDQRYIRVDGKPLFLVYSASKLPDPVKTTSIWREEALRAGIGEIFLGRVESFTERFENPIPIGFDAAVEFQLNGRDLDPPLRQGRLWCLARKFRLTKAVYGYNDIYDYRTVVEKMLARPSPSYKRFPCVTPNWDNTPRRKTGVSLLVNSTPKLYEKWLRGVISTSVSANSDEKLIFINAWNEWAEGAYLEPCQKWGRAYLEATKRVINSHRE